MRYGENENCVRQNAKEFDARTELPLEWNNCLFISSERRRFEVHAGFDTSALQAIN